MSKRIGAQNVSTRGGTRSHVGVNLVHAREMPSHTKLKFRAKGQQTKDEISARDLKAELEERERIHQSLQRKDRGDWQLEAQEQMHRADEIRISKRRKLGRRGRDIVHFSPEDAPAEDKVPAKEGEEDLGRFVEEAEKFKEADKDEEESEDESEESSSDEDDEAALMREWEKIKKEREEEQKRTEAMEKERVASEREDAMLHGNPLLDQDSTFNTQRRWHDDTVFKNQAREPAGTSTSSSFINDTTRNPFHVKFMAKYIK